MNKDNRNTYLKSIDELKETKAHRKEQFKNDNRIIDDELSATRNQLAQLERLLAKQRARIKRVLLVWFVVTVLIFIVGIYIMESQKIGSPPILMVIVFVSFFLIDPIAYAKGRPEDTEKAIKLYPPKIASIESKRIPLRQAYEKDITKFDHQIADLRKKVTNMESIENARAETISETDMDADIAAMVKAADSDSSANSLTKRELGYSTSTQSERSRDVSGILEISELAERGDVNAMYQLAMCYEQGIAVEESLKKAFYYHNMAAKRGYVKSQYALGVYYSEGLGTRKNQSKAVEWFMKAAEQGYVMALYRLGICYLEGIGIRRNKELAIKLLRNAADKGHSGARSKLHEL